MRVQGIRCRRKRERRPRKVWTECDELLSQPGFHLPESCQETQHSEAVFTQHMALLWKSCLKVLYLSLAHGRRKKEDFTLSASLWAPIFPLFKVHPWGNNSILPVCRIQTIIAVLTANSWCDVPFMFEHGRVTQSCWSPGRGRQRGTKKEAEQC